jgi:hypothetical protein
MGEEFFQSVAQLIELSETRGYSYDHIVIEASGVSCMLSVSCITSTLLQLLQLIRNCFANAAERINTTLLYLLKRLYRVPDESCAQLLHH